VKLYNGIMAETPEDFSVQRFVQQLFEDLSLTLPSLGCRFEGVVAPTAATVHAPSQFLKNKLFLLFADIAAKADTLKVQFTPAPNGADLILEFTCQPFDSQAFETLPNFDKGLFGLLTDQQKPGFQLTLPGGMPAKKAPPLDWSQLAQLYGSPANGRQVLDQFLARCPTLLAELQTAIRSAESTAVLRFAHTLKGSARGVTAVAVAEAAFALETLGRTGNLSTASDLYKALLDTYDEFILWVREGQ